jgi:hypothetical protein
MTNTRPVPNLNAAIAQSSDGKLKVFLASPWMQFFQQFVQKAPAAQDVTSLGSPYTANQNGIVIITNAATITLNRGAGSFPNTYAFSVSIANNVPIPVSIGDTIEWTGPTNTKVTFLGD